MHLFQTFINTYQNKQYKAYVIGTGGQIEYIGGFHENIDKDKKMLLPFELGYMVQEHKNFEIQQTTFKSFKMVYELNQEKEEDISINI